MKKGLLTFAFILFFIISFGQHNEKIFTSDNDIFWVAYDNSKNKKKAIKEIVELKYTPKNVKKFLKKSKYNAGQK